MTRSNSGTRSRLDLFHVTFGALRLLFTAALGSIAGYMVVGGIVGTIGLMLGLDSITQYAPAVGWLLGAAGGLATEIPRLRKPAKDLREQGKRHDGAFTKAKKNALKLGSNFGIPSMKDFAKSMGLGSLFGLLLGVMTSLFLSVLLISVTTSPFVPNSWRPGTSAVSQDRTEQERRRLHRDSGARVESSFTHPLLGPIFATTTGSLLALGFVAGVITAFFPENEDRFK